MKNSRKRYYVDNKVQRDIIKRFIVHWILFVFVACLTLTIWMALNQPDLQKPISEHLREMAITAGLLFTCLLTLLPYFIFDALKLTNRFAGPMLRLHRTIKAAARGEEVQPIRFRDGDYWQDVAEDFSRMIACYQMGQKAKQTESSASDKDTPEPVGVGND